MAKQGNSFDVLVDVDIWNMKEFKEKIVEHQKLLAKWGMKRALIIHDL